MNSTIDQIPEDINIEFRSLSDAHKKLLAILPIPSATLSIFGSTIIIVMLIKGRKQKPWIPYQRLLLAMSICDIISSLTLAAGAFLYPKETSDKVWVIGNDASCSAIGVLNQLSYSGTLYNGMLSFYFLFTAKFGMKNEYIQKRIEPTMHVFSIGFPFVTAFVGLYLGVYAEPEVGIGCWVNRWPKFCGYGPDGTGEECQSPLIAWIFGAWIALFVLATLIVNNAVIWVLVHQRTRGVPATRVSRVPNEKPDETSDSNSHISEEETKTSGAGRSTKMGMLSMASSFHTLNTGVQSGNASIATAAQREIQATQNRRLRLVGSQAFFFVGCYFVCNIWTYILRAYEAGATEYVEEKELPYNYYYLLVLQAALLPLQGLFNMMVYMRPKYLRFRSEFPAESKWTTVHRVIFGAAAKANDSVERVTGKGVNVQAPIPKLGVSSLTISSEVQQQGAETAPQPRPTLQNDLSAILETSERSVQRSQRFHDVAKEKLQSLVTRSSSEEAQLIMGNSDDSSLFMQGTGWSSSLESSSRSLKARPSIPEDAVADISSQMHMMGSSSDGSTFLKVHTGWSSNSDGSRTISKQRPANKGGRESSSSFSTTFMHTGWSNSMDSVPPDAPSSEEIRARVSLNLEAKRKQLMDMQYNSESDSTIDVEKPQSLLLDPEDTNNDPTIKARNLSKSSGSIIPMPPPSERGESGDSRDSFFMATGWSSGSMPLHSASGGLEESTVMTTSKRTIPAPPPSSERGESGDSRDSFFMATGWSSDNMPLYSSSGGLEESPVMTTSKRTIPAPPPPESGHSRDSFFMSTGWSSDNMPLYSSSGGLEESPLVTSSKHEIPTQIEEDESESSLGPYEYKTGWSTDDMPLVPSPRSSPVVTRKTTDPRASPSIAHKSNTSMQMTIEEESSVHESSDDDDLDLDNSELKPPSMPDSAGRRNSATMVMMDGSFRSL